MSAGETPSTYGRQRQAAARNRVAVPEVGHELLAESATFSVNEIAKRAGLGAGTLYGHFPAREDLILAVYGTTCRSRPTSPMSPRCPSGAGGVHHLVRDARRPHPGQAWADVLLLMGYLWRVGPDAEVVAQGRLTQIVLDGIRAGRPGDRPT